MRIRWRSLGLIVLLGVFFAQAVAASPHNAVTFDEQYHITPGYVYLKTGDLRFHRDQNPPFFESLASLPLLLRSDLNLPIDHPAYAVWDDVYLFSDDFLWHANTDAQGMVHSGRVMVAGFGVLLGLLLFVWGKQLYGEKAGWLAAFLLAFDPNFIANAIPTLDLGLAFFAALAVWRLWHYLQRPTRLNILMAGLALGAALATKFIGVMLLPSFALMLILYPITTDAQRHAENSTSWRLRGFVRRALAFLAMLAVAWIVVWVVYRFQFGPVSGAGLPVPAPLYFESFIGMFLKSGEGRAIFLNGQVSMTGWPYYFAVALLLKTPIPVLLVTLAALLRWPWRREWRESSILIVPAVIFFAAASASRLQLGYRYILPALPFLFLIAGRLVTPPGLPSRLSLRPLSLRPLRVPFGQGIGEAKGLSSKAHRFFASLRMTVGIALAAWLIIGTLSIFPHYLSYFNEIADGPANGYQHLVDSNLDWGQDLPALKEWIDVHRPANLHLAFFGSAYPDRYGIQATGLPGYPLNAFGREADGFTSYSLEPGLYAISATSLRLGLVAKQIDLYRAFASMTPIDRAAYSILIYAVEYPADAGIDRAVIAGPIASDVAPDELGVRPDHPLRAKWCAWPECFVFTPHPARYIVRDFVPFAPNLAAQAHNLARIVRSVPSQGYSVFDLDATSLIESKLLALQSAPVGTPDEVARTFPIPFDNGLSLVGYEVNTKALKPSQGFAVNTYWRVDRRITPPVTIFVHLLDAQGNIRGQHDGFGAALTTLEPGDIVIQHHTITVDANAAPGTYRLQVGLYNPDTLQRFTVSPSIDRVLLSTLEVVSP